MAEAIASLPLELLPLTAEPFPLPDGQIVGVLKAFPTFSRCEKPALFDDFGGKPVLKHAGTPCFAELLIQRLFVAAGWSARWVETYGAPAMKPRFLTNWDSKGLRAQINVPIADPTVRNLLESVAHTNGGTYSGCWDVVAWTGERIFFAEAKRKAHDHLRSTQHRWVAAAMKVGIPAESFVIVEWSLA